VPPQILILDSVPVRDWPKYERAWIASLKDALGERLTNLHPGGMGGDTMSGKRHRPETIEKMRKVALKNRENRARAGASRQNKTPWSKGKTMSKEFCENVSAGRMGIAPWNKGVSTPQHVREKISVAVKHTFSGPEYRRSLSERTRDQWANMTDDERKRMTSGARRPKSAEARRNMSIAQSKRWEGRTMPQEHREAIARTQTGKKKPSQSRAMKEYYKDPAARAKTGNASREMWQDPEIRRKIIAARTGKKRGPYKKKGGGANAHS